MKNLKRYVHCTHSNIFSASKEITTSGLGEALGEQIAINQLMDIRKRMMILFVHLILSWGGDSLNGVISL